MKKISQVKPGQSPTMLHSALANAVIDAVNAMTNLEVQPPGIAELQVESDKAVLTLETQTTAMVVDGSAGFYDVVAIPSESGGSSEDAATAIKDALDITAGTPVTVRAMVVDGDTVSFETVTLLMQIAPE